jgi:SAM-dependent methyltransferase
MPEAFDKTYWEERYRSHSGDHRAEPNGQLVTEAADLPPGTALDAGCGEGADAIWLALRGWQVTAVDISATALGHARQHAMTLGIDIADRIDWIEGDLTTWKPQREHYDLVTSQYVHPTGPFDALAASLAAAVAPGGTLLIVGHHPAGDHEGHGDDESHVPAPGSFVSVDEVTAALDPEQWEILVAETRSRTATVAHGEPVILHDSVVKARRRV